MGMGFGGKMGFRGEGGGGVESSRGSAAVSNLLLLLRKTPRPGQDYKVSA